MPAALTYPGVYVEEIPSGVRTITGVATSITAFIGRAVRGLVNEPTIINSYGEFERRFGGLGVNYPMSYAVRDFFANGGSQAAIVRLYNPPSDKDDGRSRLSLDGLDLVAASPGEWGKKLRVTIDVEVSDEVRGRLGLGKDDALFNLRVSDSNRGGASERFMNLTVVDSPRRLDKVLQAESNLIRWDGDWPDEANKLPKLAKTKATRQKLQDLLKEQKADKPDPNKIQMAREHYSDAQKDLEDDATTASKQLDAARKARPQVQADVLAAEQALEDAETKLKGDDGKGLDPNAYLGSEGDKTGLRALDKTDQFNLLCIPPDDRGEDVPVEVYQTAMEYCQHRRAVLIVDSPAIWGANKETAASTAKDGLSALGLAGEAARNAALYFPRVVQPDPYHEGRPDIFVPCGIVAGIMARTDVTRGVWKAPAGLDAATHGVLDLEVNRNDAESGMLTHSGLIACALSHSPVVSFGGHAPYGAPTNWLTNTNMFRFVAQPSTSRRVFIAD